VEKEMTCPSEKPPLGLTPRFIVEERRMKEILGAIQRYCDAQRLIPSEWVEELSEIINQRFPYR
jgi:hypothetical protein